MKSKVSYQLSRRDFLRYGTCGAMGIGSIVNTLSQLTLINSAAASTVGGSDVVGNDYKALICVFLRGGCDMNNVLIPVAGNSQAAGYAQDRGAVAIPNGVAHPTYNPSGANDTLAINGTPEPFGLHPSLVNLQGIYEANEATFVTNVGTLAEPTAPNSYGSVTLPTQLFSHSDQVTEWMSSIADQPYRSGWCARVAELFNDTWNPDGVTSMLVTAAGNNQFQNGSISVPQYSVTSNGAVSLAGFGTNYANAVNDDGSYNLNRSEGRRLRALERIMAYSHGTLIEDSYAAVIRRARDAEGVISEALQEVSNLGLDFETTFTSFDADNGVGNEFRAIAQLIAGRKCLGNRRQIFFVDLGGFDNHQDINDDLSSQLAELDSALGAFNQAMKDIAAVDADFSFDDITTFQASDFNRTWTPNGTDPNSAGTDHAWGTHAIVMGGAVNGGVLHGAFPELVVGGLNDVPSGTRGRWIPTTSVDQYCAVLANWFGVPIGSSEMDTIFPNLNRFDDPFTNGSGLSFL